jgi:hypothetical protein
MIGEESGLRVFDLISSGGVICVLVCLSIREVVR